jgi:hypothetical protein
MRYSLCIDATTSAKLVVIDLESKKTTTTLSVGADPDVLAFDTVLRRVYVSAESGVLTILEECAHSLEKVAEDCFAPNAHSVAVDSSFHHVFFPLQNLNGKPVLRIAVPADK